MSDDGSSSPVPEPRRSGRDRNASQTNANRSTSSAAESKRTTTKSKKRAPSPDPDKEDEEDEEEPSPDEESDSEEEFVVAKPKKKTPTKRSSMAKGKGKGKATSDDDDDDEDEETTPKARKPRASAAAKGKGKAQSRGKGKQKALDADEDEPEDGGEGFQEGADVKRDNVFFNAIISGKAFDPVIENWVEQYEEDEEQALGELVVFLLRASGSSAQVTPPEAVDVDGIVSMCDDIEKEKSLGSYPLINKSKTFKRFHPALTSFLSSFITNLSTTDHLYGQSDKKNGEPSPILHVFQSWLFSLCSSRLRSFRHTATVVALETMTALCEVASDVREELGTASRQREQERKKAGKEGPGKAAATKHLKELERKVKEVHWKKGKLEGYLTEIFNTVFVMRYRDTEALIRTVCVKELGVWMKTLPDLYLESAYFKYVGWMLDDISSSTRLETVKALSTLYADPSNASSLSSFTERFKRRLLQMAFHDIDLSVRTTAIGILNHVDRSGMLDDEKRRQVGLLVFDSEGRVRKAVAGFFEGRWEEERDEMLEEIEGAQRRAKKSSQTSGRKKVVELEDQEVLKTRIGWKCLASMLVRFSHALDDASAPLNDDDESLEDPSARDAAEELKAWVDMAPKGRIGSAVESLWDKVENLRDWEGLVEFLGLDHSTGEDEDEETVDANGWKLDEDEEGCLIQVLVAGLRKVKAQAEKQDDSSISQEMTRILVKALPKLIAKHQTDVSRLADILSIPHLMSLEMYLDLRMVTAYETLWDDLTKVFLKNSESIVLGPAITAISYLLSSDTLANTNTAKYVELEDALFTSLRTAVDGRDVDSAGLNEDDVAALSSICMRIGLLYNYKDLGAAMDEDEGGKQSSGWAIILALGGRGSLGYKEESKFVDHSLEILNKYLLWRTLADREDSSRREDLKEKRTAFLERLEEFAVGNQSNSVDIVRRTAFNLLLNLHVLFNPATDLTPIEKRDNIYSVPEELELTLDEQVQWRCAGFMQAEIEKYAEEKVDLTASQLEVGSDEEMDDEDDDAPPKKKGGKKKEDFNINGPNEATLAAKHRFISTVGSYLIALRVGVLDIQHSSTILAHFGRFGVEYDACCRLFVEDLRQLACYGGSSGGSNAAKVIVESLKDSFALFADGSISETELVALSKLLAGAVVVHGAQFKTLKRMDSRALVTIHTDLFDWLSRQIVDATKGTNKSKKQRNALLFFKTLTALAGALDGRESMKIQTHLKESFTKHSIEISTTKIWDHERAYEKKLTTTMSKDPKIAKGARKQVADAINRESSPAPGARGSSPTAAARPKRGRPAAFEDDDDEEVPAAKKSRPKLKAKVSSMSAPTVDEDEEQIEEPVNNEPMDFEMTKAPPAQEEEIEEEEAAGGALSSSPLSPATKDSAPAKPESTSSNSSVESVVNTGRKKKPRRG